MSDKTEYPKWIYHAEKGGRIVRDEASEKALGLGWHDCPAKARESAKPSLVQPIKSAATETVSAPTKIIRKAKA